MAGESSGLWNNLPSIIIVEILSFLKLKDRLGASSVCKAWRTNLFHPKLWRNVVFQLNSCDKGKSVNRLGATFLAKNCGRFVREVVIEVNSTNPCDVQLCKEVLAVLACNNNLRALSIKPLSSRLERTDYNDSQLLDQFISCLAAIVSQARCLEHLSLGCVQDLTDASPFLLPLLAAHPCPHLRSLHLNSVRGVQGSIPHPSSALLQPFLQLEALSIDYKYVSDGLLELLAHRRMRKLCINVHAVDSVPKPSDAAWKQLSACCPSLQVTLTLLHVESDAAPLLSGCMPLAHFRSYFSPAPQLGVVAGLALLHHATLRSLFLVGEILEDLSPPPHASFLSNHIDPLVMLAWRCQRLETLKVIGYEVGADSLIAISRLRGPQLQDLQIPEWCISTTQLEESEQLDSEEAFDHMLYEVSLPLQKYWEPMTVSELPLAMISTHVDAEQVYLEQLLQDQAW